MKKRKCKKGQMTVGMMIVATMLIFAGLALIQAIFNGQSLMTTKQVSNNENTNLSTNGCYVGNQVNTGDIDCNITVNARPTDWKISLCPLESITVANKTGVLTLNTDYRVNASSGVIQMLNTTSTNNSAMDGIARYNYTYCADGYNTDPASRTMAGMIGLFAVIALVITLAYFGLKEYL